jgi:hypothetical protein
VYPYLTTQLQAAGSVSHLTTRLERRCKPEPQLPASKSKNKFSRISALLIPRKVRNFHKASPFCVYPKILFICAEFVQKQGMVMEEILSEQ